MAFFSRRDRSASTVDEHPPLRDRDLDALSDRELEALLFDGEPPEEQKDEERSWFSRHAWKIVAFAAMMVLAGSKGRLVGQVALFLAFFYFIQKGCSFENLSWPSSSSASRDAALTRSATDRKLMGVCGGIAEYFDVDATLVRFGFILGLLASGGAPVALAYLAAAYLMPQPAPAARSSTREERMRIIRES